MALAAELDVDNLERDLDATLHVVVVRVHLDVLRLLCHVGVEGGVLDLEWQPGEAQQPAGIRLQQRVLLLVGEAEPPLQLLLGGRGRSSGRSPRDRDLRPTARPPTRGCRRCPRSGSNRRLPSSKDPGSARRPDRRRRWSRRCGCGSSHRCRRRGPRSSRAGPRPDRAARRSWPAAGRPASSTCSAGCRGGSAPAPRGRVRASSPSAAFRAGWRGRHRAPRRGR